LTGYSDEQILSVVSYLNQKYAAQAGKIIRIGF
jgi:hypothetical protein